MPDLGAELDIDTTPDELAYEGYRNYTYNLWFALGEFIDNSITSAYQNWSELVKFHGENYRLVIEIAFVGDLSDEIEFESELAQLLANEPGWNPCLLTTELKYETKDAHQFA